jgi:MFS family permease
LAAFCRLRRSLTRLQFLSVILDLYLDAIGLGTTVIAWIFTAVLTGGAVVTILITTAADTFGRKQVLILGALLMALAGCVFALTSNPLVLTRAAVFGTISLSGKEVGPFLYQASDSATDESRSSQDEGFLRLQSCRLNLWSIRSAWLWRFHTTQVRESRRYYGTYLVNPVLGLQFLLVGVLKIVLRLVDLRVFRNLRPLEEESATKTAQGC